MAERRRNLAKGGSPIRTQLTRPKRVVKPRGRKTEDASMTKKEKGGATPGRGGLE